MNLLDGHGDGGRGATVSAFRPSRRLGGFVAAFTVALGAFGCVRRTMTITTEPPHAHVFLNDQEIGVSTVKTDFTWYGDYDVVIRKKGYDTLHTHWKITPPWYQLIPIDFFTEVLWPKQFHDQRSKHFELTPTRPPDTEALVKRALDVRKRALDPRK